MATPLIHYYGVCERTDDSLWSEPLNALTNIAFIIAGLALIRYYKDHSHMEGKWVWDIRVLIGLIFCIGGGSFIFHAYPTKYTEMGDIAFIVTFIVIYFISAIRRITGCNNFETFISIIAFTGFTHFLITQFPNALNDSIAYLSSMTALCMIAFHLNMKRRRSARQFLAAALVGVISLFFRGVDNAICDYIPVGSHFMWHSLNALLIYILMVQLIRNVNRKARLARARAKQRAKQLNLDNA